MSSATTWGWTRTISTSAGSGEPVSAPILVTGASGFVGSYLVPWLERRGVHVRAMVRDLAKGRPLAAAGAELVAGDLLDPASLARAVQDVEAIVHLAAVADSSDADLNERVNVGGTRALAEAADAAGVLRFINVSSTCAGRGLRDAYGETKRLAEGVLDATDLDVTHLRPAMIYGAGSKEWDIFTAVVRRLPLVPLPGTGSTVLRPVYLDDMLDLVGRVLDRPAAVGRTYDVAGPEPVTTADLVARTGRAMGRRRRALTFPARAAILGARAIGAVMQRPPVNVDQVMAFMQDTVVDIEPARTELGWEPRGLDDGLAALFGGEA